jgi:hypothetical protein
MGSPLTSYLTAPQEAASYTNSCIWHKRLPKLITESGKDLSSKKVLQLLPSLYLTLPPMSEDNDPEGVIVPVSYLFPIE